MCVSVYVRARKEGGMIKEEDGINLRVSWGAYGELVRVGMM